MVGGPDPRARTRQSAPGNLMVAHDMQLAADLEGPLPVVAGRGFAPVRHNGLHLPHNAVLEPVRKGEKRFAGVFRRPRGELTVAGSHKFRKVAGSPDRFRTAAHAAASDGQRARSVAEILEE